MKGDDGEMDQTHPANNNVSRITDGFNGYLDFDSIQHLFLSCQHKEKNKEIISAKPSGLCAFN